jgi:16S rRNA (uracil1498-N3)-methyltransferase
MRKIRLFIDEKELKIGGEIKIVDSDFNYLANVMRKKAGERVALFNGRDGEFQAVIREIGKKFLILVIEEKIAEVVKPLNVKLAFALIKNVGVDFIAQKATELGVASFQPLVTQNSVIDKINLERFQANVKEACEQCERNDFPEIFELKKLEKFLAETDISQKILILCDESGQGAKAGEVLTKVKMQRQENQEIVVFVGPGRWV